MSIVYCFLFFFFQAEDGIRDGLVARVQTCALPIFAPRFGTDRPATCILISMRPIPILRRSFLAHEARAVAIALAFVAACHHDSVTGPNAAAGPVCGDGSVILLSPNQASTLVCGINGKIITLSGDAKY